MATAKTKVEAEEKKAPEVDLNKFEHLIVKSAFEKDGKTYVECKLPIEKGKDDRMFGLNGRIIRIQLGKWVELSLDWAEFIEEHLRDEERLLGEIKAVYNKFSGEQK